MQTTSDRVMRPRESGNSMAGREGKMEAKEEAAGRAKVEPARPE